MPAILVADDTDVLILLCWQYKTISSRYIRYFRRELHQGAKTAPSCWNMTVMRTVLGPQVCNNTLFVNTILGCDTTPSLNGVGKKIGLKLISTNKVFFEQAQVFSKQNSTKAEVIAAEDKALLHIYKGLPGDALNFLRFQRFHQKVGSSISLVQPEVLPPSSAAAAYHSLCVYPQVQDWIGKATEMSPEDWGWYTHKVIISC